MLLERAKEKERVIQGRATVAEAKAITCGLAQPLSEAKTRGNVMVAAEKDTSRGTARLPTQL